MLSIEEYIAKRKKEDKLNEFDINKRLENIRICTNYIFEYFEKYLDITDLEEKTILNKERLNKYRKQLHKYEKDIQDWLVDMYDKYGKYMHKNIGRVLEEEDIFLLYSEEHEFRNISYECYSKLIKKYPFLKNQADMIYRFIKDHHRVMSEKYTKYSQLPFFTQAIDDWIEETQIKYGVSIPAFVNFYIERFYDLKDKWPTSHKKKSDSPYFKYDYDYKQKKNLFNLDSVYTKISNKPFIRGKKQELELIMMYYWLHNIEIDNKYWDEYSSKVVLQLNKSS